jgi:elongation factor P hydroxylase
MSFTLQVFMTSVNRMLLEKWNTQLLGGFPEPLYLPSTPDGPAQIRFTRDYIRSALHELAHWCIAGPERRMLLDYGYWYRPDGRDSSQQLEFFQAEVRPQSLELAFSLICGIQFQVSCDNLYGESNAAEFELQVQMQLDSYEKSGYPSRAKAIMDLLRELQSG